MQHSHSACSPASGQTSRIAQAISSESPRIAVAHSVSPRALAATDLGEAPADRILPSVTLRFSMTAAQSSALDTLLAAQQNPASPLYRQWLTPEQFGARFGLSTADLARTTAWLQSQGLTVTGVARGQSFITVSGTVASLNAAFGIRLHTIQLKGEQHIANLTDPTLPSPLAAVVGTITGLNDLRLKPHAHPHFTSSISGNHFIAPGDFYTIYDINPLLTANVNGSGVTIAVAGQTDIQLSDMAAFRSASGLTANPPTVKLIGADPGVPTTDDQVEASIDVEWSGAVAPAASILYVNSTDVFNGSLTAIIDQNLAPIATISYGNCESGFGSSDINSYNQLFRQAAAQGQTIAGPAGDSGATDCDYQTSVASQGLAVDFPASSPYVTGVGGTMFNEGSGTYWSTTNGNFSGSALSYIPEAVWDESDSDGLSAGGGGASTFFGKPSWQIGTGVPADSHRDVPDLAFNAAAAHDPYLICQGGSCTNGYRDANNDLDAYGGTSISTPAFAAMMALLEQQLQTRVGLANPTIYALANSTYSTNVFHDVTTGTNDSPCTIGSPDCATVVEVCNSQSNTGKGCIGYNATTGYDIASGWGSLDVFNFVNNWSLVSPFGPTTTGTNASATTVVPSSTSVTQHTTLTLTATVASAASGITTTPTGRAELTLDGVETGSPVALTGAHATFTYDTSSLSLGSHTFGVVYSGDSTYQGSTASVTIAVVTGAATTTSLSAGPGTVTALQTVTFTATVTSSTPGTLTGTVQFERSSGGVTSAIGSPVTLSAGTATLPPTVIPQGTYNITALYSGDANFASSTSAIASLNVTSFAVTASITPTTASVSSVQPVSFTVVVTPSSSSTPVPTGNVQFYVDSGSRGQPVPLSGGSVTSPAFTFSAGSHTVQATYIGDSVYGFANTPIATITSTLSPTTIAFTPLPPTSVAAETNITISYTVSGLTAGIPSQAQIDIMEGADVIGRFGTLTSGTTIVGSATLSFSAGTHIITAVYTGDGTYATSTSSPATIVASQGTVNIVPSTTPVTITAGQSATDTVNFVSVAFTSTQLLYLSCTVTFNGTGTATNIPSCGINPPTINFASGPKTDPATLSISSVAASAVTAGPQAHNGTLKLLPLGGATLAALLLFVVPRRTRRIFRTAHYLSIAILIIPTLTTLFGCGGAGSGSGGSPTAPTTPTNPGTTKGSYTINVTAATDPNETNGYRFIGTIPLTIQ